MSPWQSSYVREEQCKSIIVIDSHKFLSDVGQPFNDAGQIAHDTYDCSACN
jgi:hypothetical protein